MFQDSDLVSREVDMTACFLLSPCRSTSQPPITAKSITAPPLLSLKLFKICLCLFGDGVIGAKELLLNGQCLAEERLGFIIPLLIHQDGGMAVQRFSRMAAGRVF
jgi:hypothetical protein